MFIRKLTHLILFIVQSIIDTKVMRLVNIGDAIKDYQNEI